MSQVNDETMCSSICRHSFMLNA